MFVELAKMLKPKDGLGITVTALDDGKLSVIVIPKVEAKANKALLTPLQTTGTPEELDAELPQLLDQFVGTHKSLREQVEAATAVMAAAKTEVAKTTASAVSKANTGKASTVKQALTTPATATPQGGSEQGSEQREPEAATAGAAGDPNISLFGGD